MVPPVISHSFTRVTSHKMRKKEQNNPEKIDCYRWSHIHWVTVATWVINGRATNE